MKYLKAGAALVLAALVTAMLAGCFYIDLNGDSGVVVGNGEVETRDISLEAAVMGLYNETSIDVIIDMDLKDKAVLEGDSNLINLVDVSQRDDGAVSVKMEPFTSFSIRKPMTLRIPAIEGGRIEINGSGDITLSDGTLTGESFGVRIAGSGDIRLDLETKTLTLEIGGSGDMNLRAATDEVSVRSNGSGNIALSGEARKLDIALSGSGDFNGFDFPVQDAHVAINGSGDASVYVTGALTGSIGGSGNLTYDGHPASVSVSDSASGDAKPR
jgi:hypothetical protein